MDITAKVSSKGQVTIPKTVRDELGITPGDQLVFRIEPHRAVVARTGNLLNKDRDLGALPEASRNVPWDAARHSTAGRRLKATTVVRDTDAGPLTIDLADRSRPSIRR